MRLSKAILKLVLLVGMAALAAFGVYAGLLNVSEAIASGDHEEFATSGSVVALNAFYFVFWIRELGVFK